MGRVVAGFAAHPWRALALVGAVLLVCALTYPVDHDESQYHAAAMLAGLPYRDFMYLQPPVQPLLAGPLLRLFDGWSFIAARALTGALGFGVVALAYAAQRRQGVGAPLALATAALMALCHTFGFSTSVFRNDALPAALLALALWIAAGGRFEWGRWLAIGLCLGVATGTKISYLAMAGAAGAFPLAVFLFAAEERGAAFRAGLAYAAGLALALMPLLAMRAMAPESFDYDLFGFHAEAPFAWYEAVGRGYRLRPWAKLYDVPYVLVRGPALAALIGYGWYRWQHYRRHGLQFGFLLLIDLMVLAGLAATMGPTPTHRQYAMPLLPPLFVGLGMVIARSGIGGAPRALRRGLALGAVVGGAHLAWFVVAGPLTGALTPAQVTREAHWIGAVARAERVAGPVATLSPHVAIDSRLPLDPLFAAGPFAFRTGDAVAADRQARLGMVSPATLARHFAVRRPAVIVTGYEEGGPTPQTRLDDVLRRHARALGYRLFRSPYGAAEAWLAPRGRAIRR